MKQKKLISLILATLMIISTLAGCAQSEKVSEESSSTSTSQSTEASQSTVVEEEPTVITFGSTYALQSEPIPWYETTIFKKILEEANVEIEYVEYDAEQFKLALASDTLPDVMFLTKGDVVGIVSAGKALDMWPLLEEYAPNMLLDYYTERNDMMRQMYGGDNNGLYYVAPRINPAGEATTVEYSDGYNVRWDYYLEIGAPEITDDDSYIDAIEKMVAAHPKTESGEKVYGMTVWDNFNYWYMRGAYSKEASTANGSVSGTQYVADLVTNELINGYTNVDRGAFWIDMKFYNKLWNKDLLDPDSFTMTAEEFTARLTSGRYVASVYNDKNLYNNAKKDDPDTLAGYVNIPSENVVLNSGSKRPTGMFPDYTLFISSESENWEAVLRLFNVLHDPDTQRMVWSGIEGETWNYVDGVPTLTDEAVSMMSSGDEKLYEYGILYAKTAFATLQNVVLHPDGYPVDLTMTDEAKAETLNPLLKSQAEHYGVDYPLQAGQALLEAGKTIDKSGSYASFIASGIEARPTDLARIAEKSNDILYRAIPELVMAASEEEFKKVQDRVLKDLADAGEGELWSWSLERWNKSLEEMRPIIDKAN